MQKLNYKKVSCVYLGHLEYRGRLLKEIATMQDDGYDCDLVLGDIQLKEQDFTQYDFPIKVIPISWLKSQLVFYFKHFYFSWIASKYIAKSDAGIVYCFSIQALMTGVFLKLRKSGIKMVFDSNELFIECFQHKVKKLLWWPVQKLGASFCDLIIHAEPNRLTYYLDKHGARKKRHEVLQNFPNYKEDVRVKMPSPEERVRVVYFGVLGRDRYTKELVEIFHQLDHVDLDIVGYFCEKDVEVEVNRLLEQTDKTNVRLLPSVPYKEMPKLLESYHIGIALYLNTNVNNYYCAPNKVYDYIMNGLTVIANNYPGLAQVLEGNKVGSCIDEIDEESFAHAIDTIVCENRWQNIDDEMRYHFSWDNQREAYLNWMKEL